MAWERDALIVSLRAGADLTAQANRIVKLSGDDTVVLAGASEAAMLLGVIYREPASSATGSPVSVVVKGIARVTAGGAVAAGDKITSDASGRAIVAADPGTGATVSYLGVALNSSSAAGQVISVLIGPYRNTGT